MQAIIVQIHPRHLIGNTYQHGAHGTRVCPLAEALFEQTNLTKDNAYVGSLYIATQMEKTDRERYSIPYNEWNGIIVSRLIKAAEAGDEAIHTIILTLIPPHEIF